MLKVKRLDLKTGGPDVVVLDDSTAWKLGVRPKDRIKLLWKDEEITAIVNIAERFPRNAIGLFRDIWERYDIKDWEEVDVEVLEKPLAADYIRKKLDGKKLKRKEIEEIVRAINEDELSDIDVSAFVVSQYIRGMNLDEITYLVEAMVDVGQKLELSHYPILDKHSLGGVPGNKVTMIIVPMITSLGYVMPKTSSRAITSASGTADAMEVLANVSFSLEEIKEIVNSVGGCIVWGGSLNLAPVDDKLINVEKVLNIDPVSQMIASIMAKKLSVGATHLVLDFPIGPEAKVRNRLEATRLKRMFLGIAKRLKMEASVVYTSGYQPVGNGVGPLLSAKDALMVLEGNGPEDLRDKALKLAENLLKLLNAKADLREILRKGKALRKMKEIIEAQGGDPRITSEDLQPYEHEFTYTSPKNGKVVYVSNHALNELARVAGAPFDEGAGIYLHKKVGEKVKREEPLFTVYARNNAKLKRAVKQVVLKKPVVVK